MNDSSAFRLGRRAFMAGPAAVVAGLGLGRLSLPARAEDGAAPHRFVSLFFEGGWDVLLGPDPRRPSDDPAGIDLGLSRLSPEWHEPTTVTVGSTETRLGAAMAPLFPHADVLTLFRGVNMNTVAHPTGRAYVNTWLPPAGATPRGDSLATRMAAGADFERFLLPNVSIKVPSFNRSYDPAVTGIGLGRATDVVELVEPLTTPLPAEAAALLRTAQADAPSCVGADYPDAPGPQVDVARSRVHELMQQGLGPVFDVSSDAALRERYGIEDARSASDPGVVGATVWRLLELGLTTSVTAQLQRGLDTHGDEWASLQPARLRAGFRAVAALLEDLRRSDPSLENTTVVVHSEFARTPRINGRGGRDHWFANSILVFGGGLRPGVFGATAPGSLGLVRVDLQSGLPADNGEVVRLEHIGATLAHAKGRPFDDFRVEPLDAWIA